MAMHTLRYMSNPAEHTYHKYHSYECVIAEFDINYKLYHYATANDKSIFFQILFGVLFQNVHNSTTINARENTSTDFEIVKGFLASFDVLFVRFENIYF